MPYARPANPLTPLLRKTAAVVAVVAFGPPIALALSGTGGDDEGPTAPNCGTSCSCVGACTVWWLRELDRAAVQVCGAVLVIVCLVVAHVFAKIFALAANDHAMAVRYQAVRGVGRAATAVAVKAAAKAAKAAGSANVDWRASLDESNKPRGDADADGAESSSPSALVCVGDSITHATVSGDWVSMLQAKVGDALGVACFNEGVNGECMTNMLERAPYVRSLRPKWIVVLGGTNDVKGCFNTAWAAGSVAEHRVPELNNWSQFRRTTAMLLAALTARSASDPNAEVDAPRVAICTLPLMGEDLDSAPNEMVAEANNIIRAEAAAAGVDVLDVTTALADKLKELRAADGHAARTPAPFEGWLGRMFSGLFRKVFLGRSWDAVAESFGYYVLSEGLHLSDTGGQVVADVVEKWMRREGTGSGGAAAAAAAAARQHRRATSQRSE